MKTTPLIRILGFLLCAAIPFCSTLHASDDAAGEPAGSETATIQDTDETEATPPSSDLETTAEVDAAFQQTDAVAADPEEDADSNPSEPSDGEEATADDVEDPSKDSGDEPAPSDDPSESDEAAAHEPAAHADTPVPSEESNIDTQEEEHATAVENSEPSSTADDIAEAQGYPPTTEADETDTTDGQNDTVSVDVETSPAPIADNTESYPSASGPDTSQPASESMPQIPVATPSDARQGFSPWYLEEYPAYWPKQVTLRVGMNFPGFSLPALSLVDVKDVKGLQVFFEREGKLYALYFDDTDIIARAWEVYRNPQKQNTVVDAGRIYSDTLLWPESVRLINPVAFGQGAEAFTLPTGTELPFGRIKDEQVVSEYKGETIVFNISACDILEKAASNMVIHADEDRYLTTRSMLNSEAWYLFRKGEFIPYDSAVGTRTDLYILFFIDEKTSIPFAASLASQIEAYTEKLRRMDVKVEVIQVSYNPDQQKHLKALVALKPEWPVMIHESGLSNRLLRQITFQRNLPGVVWLKADGSIQDQVFGIRTPDDLRYTITQNATGVQN